MSQSPLKTSADAKCPKCLKPYRSEIMQLGDLPFELHVPTCTCLAEAEEQQRQRDRVERANEYAQALAKQVGPRLWREATFEDFIETPSNAAMLRAAQEYSIHGPPPPRCLVLSGPSGCGKTRLALAAARRQIERFVIKARFITATEFLRAMRGCFPSEALDLIKALKSVPLLILDDVQPLTDRERIDLLELIDARYRAEAPLIVTTNIRVQDFDAALGMQISSRLQDALYSKVTTVQQPAGDIWS